MLSRRALQVLRDMAADPEDADAEIIAVGRNCYRGNERIHRATVNQLIRASAITRDVEELPYWHINTTGEAIARRPELAGEVFSAMCRGTPFTIRHDRVVLLDAPTSAADQAA